MVVAWAIPAEDGAVLDSAEKESQGLQAFGEYLGVEKGSSSDAAWLEEIQAEADRRYQKLSTISQPRQLEDGTMSADLFFIFDPGLPIITASEVSCSSDLPGFECGKLIDGSNATSWNDASLQGVDARIVFEFSQRVLIEEVIVENLPDEAEFRRNFRVRGYEIFDGDGLVLASGELADTTEPQRLVVGGVGLTSLQFNVTSTYAAESFGDEPPFRELAIAEVRFLGRYESP